MKIRDLKYLWAYLIPFSAFFALQLQENCSLSSIIITFGLILFFKAIPNAHLQYINQKIKQFNKQNVLSNKLHFLNILIISFLILNSMCNVQSALFFFGKLGTAIDLGIIIAVAGFVIIGILLFTLTRSIDHPEKAISEFRTILCFNVMNPKIKAFNS